MGFFLNREQAKIFVQGTEVKLYRGDITDLVVDAVISPDDTEFSMKEGVSCILREFGGEVVAEEARRFAPAPLGKIVVTSGGRLPAKYVFHAAVITPQGEIVPETTRMAMRNALERAEVLNLRSVAFPAIGLPSRPVAYEVTAELMLKEALYFLRNQLTYLRLILFSLYNQESFQKFKAQLVHLRQREIAV